MFNFLKKVVETVVNVVKHLFTPKKNTSGGGSSGNGDTGSHQNPGGHISSGDDGKHNHDDDDDDSDSDRKKPGKKPHGNTKSSLTPAEAAKRNAQTAFESDWVKGKPGPVPLPAAKNGPKQPVSGQSDAEIESDGPGVIVIPVDTYMMAKTTQLGRSIVKAFVHEGLPGAEVTALNWLRHFARYGWDFNETAQAHKIFDSAMQANAVGSQLGNQSGQMVMWLRGPVISQTQTPPAMPPYTPGFPTNTPAPTKTPQPELALTLATNTAMPTYTATPTAEQQRYLLISQQVTSMVRDDPAEYSKLLAAVQRELDTQLQVQVDGTYMDDQARVITWVILNNLAWTKSGDYKAISNLANGYKTLDNVLTKPGLTQNTLPFNANHSGADAIKRGVDQALQEFYEYGYRTKVDPSKGALQWFHPDAYRDATDPVTGKTIHRTDAELWKEAERRVEEQISLNNTITTIPPVFSEKELDYLGDRVTRLGYLVVYSIGDPASIPGTGVREIGGSLIDPIKTYDPSEFDSDPQ